MSVQSSNILFGPTATTKFQEQYGSPNVVVTGAAGFIGSHLVESLVKDGENVKAFCFYNSNNYLYLPSH